MNEQQLASNIICPDHGPFAVLSDDHLAGEGCPICDGLTTNRVIIGDIEQNMKVKDQSPEHE